MHSSSKKKQATALRKSGKSIDYIAKRLRVSKSTVSVWVRDISLSVSQKQKLRESSKNAGIIAFKNAAEKRHLEHQQKLSRSQRQGKKDIGRLSKKDTHLIGLGLYWGEGYKKGSEEFGFTNSDPHMIRFFLKWIYSYFSVKKKDIVLRVSINSLHKGSEKLILDYWSRTTGIPLSQFTKTSFLNTQQKKTYPSANTYRGTLRVKVRGGSGMRARVLASIDKIKQN